MIPYSDHLLNAMDNTMKRCMAAFFLSMVAFAAVAAAQTGASLFIQII